MRKGVFLAGLLVLGIGLYIVWLAIGIAPNSEGASPQWIVGMAGMAFVLGGGLVGMGELLRYDGASGLRDVEVAQAFRNFMIALLLIVFAVLGNWVAFGPGTRPIAALIGMPLDDPSVRNTEWVGRLGFGISAFVLDAFLVLVGILFYRRKIQKPGERN